MDKQHTAKRTHTDRDSPAETLVSRVRMKMKLFCFPAVMAMIFALAVMNSGLTMADLIPTPSEAPRWWTTTGSLGVNLNGKMFTLPLNRGSVIFYPPFYSAATPPSWLTTTPYTTNQSISYPWTTASPTRGVSVCLRYLADYPSFDTPTIFTLSPSRTPLKLQVGDSGLQYIVTFDENGNYLSLRPNLRFWGNIGQDIWNRVCVTVDTVKNVAQVFQDSNMSIKKKLRYRYVWSGEPKILFPGFDGQVTDVQVWDYPLRYREILNYMSSGFFGPHYGSILTWSSIGYSPTGITLLEDVYELQAKEPISSKGRGCRPKGEKKTRERKRQL